MGGKFIVKAGQHIFDVGENSSLEIPILPVLKTDHTHILNFDVRHKLEGVPIGYEPKYSLIDSKGGVRFGTVPKDGIIKVHGGNEKEEYSVIIHDIEHDVMDDEE